VTSIPGSTPEDDTGLASFANGTLPRWLSYSSIEYSRGKVNAFLGWHHIPGVTNIVTEEDIASFDSFDVSASYVFGSEI
jgi:iron complex outermembrane receptor protein